jgi:hypothetical protein
MRELTNDPELSADFSEYELNLVLQNVKSGKSAGLDGIYPEFIKKRKPKNQTMDCRLLQ